MAKVTIEFDDVNSKQLAAVITLLQGNGKKAKPVEDEEDNEVEDEEDEEDVIPVNKKKTTGKKAKPAAQEDEDEEEDADEEDVEDVEEDETYTKDRVVEKCQQLINKKKAPQLKALLEKFN
ncbi:MAG TPA: hypothetical protein VEA37_09085, partial [Flavobacterium sp.]|nr:hypothetical protein [Flavobacterium sp.]